MLAETVALLVTQLNQYIHQLDGSPAGAPGVAVSGNIAQMENPDLGPGLENQIVLSVVNLQEEGSLKNGPTQFSPHSGGSDLAQAGSEVRYRNRPIHLNLQLLLSANYRNYDTALRRLTQVLLFFQGKRHFTWRNSPGAEPAAQAGGELSLSMDLQSLSFEEVNHLWGFLGGKQVPFVLYRGRLIAVDAMQVFAGGGIVQEIDLAGRGLSY
jgi:hypothetical protein